LQWMMASLSADWLLTANGRRCLFLILTDVVTSSSNGGFGMRSSQGPRASRRRGPAFNDHLQWMMASLSAEWHLTANGRRCLFLILSDVVTSSSNGGLGMRSSLVGGVASPASRRALNDRGAFLCNARRPLAMQMVDVG